jgi:Leucine-rich repeat (LRR) protein
LRLRCGPPGAPDVPPWSISELLTRHQRCQLAVVDLQHLPTPAANDYAGSSALSRIPPRLLYLRLAAPPQTWAFGGQLLALDVSGDGVCGGMLPEDIAACSGLRHLSISDPHLRSLPANIGSLSHLEALLLSGCSRLSQLPDSISSLANLQTLDMSWCVALQQVPGSIASLPSLKVLDVRGCIALKQLPESISRLSSLRQYLLKPLAPGVAKPCGCSGQHSR